MQLHLALVELKDENNQVDIGFSFPNYGDVAFPLGDSVRLFAYDEERFAALKVDKFLARLSDYLEISPIKKVPDNVAKYAQFSRVHFKSYSQIRRSAKRKAEREGIAYDEAIQLYKAAQEKYEKRKSENDLPFVNLESLSTKKRLKLFIDKKYVDRDKRGMFSTYGLSSEATLPVF